MKKTWILLTMLLVLIIIPACEQDQETENSITETANTSAEAEKDQHAASESENGEEVNNTATDDKEDVKDEVTYFEAGGFSFSYPDFIGGEVSFEAVAASDEDAFIIYPEHKRVSFNDYLLSDTLISPQIQIFSFEEYLIFNDCNTKIIKQTELILDRQSFPEDVIEAPFVPQPMAVQMFYANLDFTENQSGSGLRFVTQYGQDVGPVTNDSLFYVYQGITADGRYYISATFPVHHPDLPSGYEDFFSSTGMEYNTFEKNYPEYLDTTVQMLDNAGPADFIPALNMLDAIMADLTLE